ncbi:hypothetical protein H7R52_07065 [Weissella confusa]|uniref:Uncharacterized protein n=1 Tax=Weissella confusa TaxID=1583 RepID=A0A923NDH0_WEICO|nr:hypothetical protein [Weissella confusa]
MKSQAGTLVPQVTFDAVLEGVDKKIADYIASGKAKGDKGDPGEISGTIGGRNGLAQDVTGKTVSVTVANASGYLFDVTPKNNGTEVELDFSDAKLKELTPDTYKLEINVTNADGDIEVRSSNLMMLC